MFRKLSSMFIIILTASVLTIPAFAAPDTFNADENGNSTDLIVVTNPSTDQSTTFDSNYIVSGYGQEGANICLYLYNPIDNTYKKVVIDGSSVEWEVGASGLFMQQVDLQNGENKIALRAENGEAYQVVKLDLTLLNQSFLDNIRKMTVDIAKGLGL